VNATPAGDREYMPQISDNLPPGQRPMVAVIRAVPGHEAQLAAAIATLTTAVRQEQGCLEFRPFQDAANPAVFYLYEIYADTDAFRSFANNAPSSVIPTGVFTAGGVDHPGDKVDKVVFPNGTFKIAHSNGTGTPHFNAKTCLNTIVLNGTYRLSGGTGAYAGISGHGIYRLNLLIVGARNAAGKCSDRLPPTAFQLIIRAQGPVSL
jgi:antibiotic biosynthesis monooxygenase